MANIEGLPSDQGIPSLPRVDEQQSAEDLMQFLEVDRSGDKRLKENREGSLTQSRKAEQGSYVGSTADNPDLDAPLTRGPGGAGAVSSIDMSDPEVSKWFQATALMSFYEAMLIVARVSSKIKSKNAELVVAFAQGRYENAQAAKELQISGAEKEKLMAMFEMAGHIVSAVGQGVGALGGLAMGEKMARGQGKKKLKSAATDMEKAEISFNNHAPDPANPSGKVGTKLTDAEQKQFADLRKFEADNPDFKTNTSEMQKARQQKANKIKEETLSNNEAAAYDTSKHQLEKKQQELNELKNQPLGEHETAAHRQERVKAEELEIAGLEETTKKHESKIYEQAEKELFNPEQIESLHKKDQLDRLGARDAYAEAKGRHDFWSDPKNFEDFVKNMEPQMMHFANSMGGMISSFGNSLGPMGRILFIVEKTELEELAKIANIISQGFGELKSALAGEESDLDKLLEGAFQAFEQAARSQTENTSLRIGGA